MPKVALFGAAGAIGKSVAASLRLRGEPYRVVGRHGDALQAAFGGDPLAEIVVWHPDDPASVAAAVAGVETIVYLLGVPYDHFELHPELMRTTLAGALAAGVARLLLIGTVYSFGLPQTRPVREDHPREPNSFKGRMRKQQEDQLLEADAAGRIRGLILRLPDFYGPGVQSSLIYDLFRAAARGGRAKLVGPIDTPHEFVFVPDVGAVVTALLDRPAAFGRSWNLAGAGVITQRQLAEMAFGLAGRKPRLLIAGRTMLRLAGRFDPMMRELIEMCYLQTNPVILDDRALRQLLGEVAKTPYAEGVRQTLETEQNMHPQRGPQPRARHS